jgi:hypothetical protein
MTDDLSTSIETNASGPKKFSGDSGSVEQHPIADQIAAHNFLQGKKAVTKPNLGLRFGKITPGGSV